MLLQFIVCFGFILPVDAPQSMVAYGTGTFAMRDFVNSGLALTALGYQVGVARAIARMHFVRN